jgi:poly(hydroxyalkanoate) granule-associated protein
MNNKKFGSKFSAIDENSVKAAGKKIVESAQQIWEAGMGALNKAQSEGSKFYETLLKEGSAVEKMTRKTAAEKVEEVRDAVETKVTQVKERAADTLDKLEKVFEDRVSKALGKLGIPGRHELNDLSKRVEQLHAALQNLDKKSPGKQASGSLRESVSNTMKTAKKTATKVEKQAKKTVKSAGKSISKASKQAQKTVKKAIRNFTR